MPYDRLYVEYLYYFNEARDYFECHEVLEALWMEDARNPLWQGLLQVAVGLYHHRNGNTGGAIKLMTQALRKLPAYEEQDIGIDLPQLIGDCDRYLKGLCNDGEAYEFHDLDIRITDPALEDLVAKLIANPPEPEEES